MKPYYYFLIVLFAAAWALAAIHPTTPTNWLQENIMVFLWVPITLILGYYLPLSDFSYAIITVFLILHLVGAHYNYGSVPFGNTLAHWLGADHNIYDRFMHFCFGFLLVYPIRELFLRISNMKGFWSYFFPINVMLSLSALYEIFEWLSVTSLPRDVGYLFIGGTDPWDGVKDMTLAGVGAITTLFILVCLHATRDKRFGQKIRNSFKNNSI